MVGNTSVFGRCHLQSQVMMSFAVMLGFKPWIIIYAGSLKSESTSGFSSFPEG